MHKDFIYLLQIQLIGATQYNPEEVLISLMINTVNLLPGLWETDANGHIYHVKFTQIYATTKYN